MHVNARDQGGRNILRGIDARAVGRPQIDCKAANGQRDEAHATGSEGSLENPSHLTFQHARDHGYDRSSERQMKNPIGKGVAKLLKLSGMPVCRQAADPP
jgi:hypothetical protein